MTSQLFKFRDTPDFESTLGNSDWPYEKIESDSGALISEALSIRAISSKSTKLIDEIGKAASAIMGNSKSAQLELNLLAFSERMHQLGKDSEVVETYVPILRLLDKNEELAISNDNRILLAQHLVERLVHPELIDQGLHGTCGYAALEFRLAKMYPSTFASFIYKVAKDGEFKSNSGQTVKIPPESLRPDDEAKVNPPTNNKRDYASQIFQLAAANVFWQTLTHDRYGRPVPPGSFIYRQEEAVSRKPLDSGERLVQILRPYLRPEDPQIPLVINGAGGESNLTRLYEVCTKLDFPRSGNFLVSRTPRLEPGVSVAITPDELKNFLQRQPALSYPIIVTVDLNAEPFRSDFESSYGLKPSERSRHIVSIESYDSKNSTLIIRNTIGAHSGSRKMTLEKLFESMY